MNRSDTIRAVSAIVRADHGAALWALGYLTLDLTQEGLDDLLSGLQEFGSRHQVRGLIDHLELVKERFGEPRR